MWKIIIDIAACFKQFESLLLFSSTLLWGIYVFYTIKTFREIRRQTELQSEAFLVTTSYLRETRVESRSTARIKEIDKVDPRIDGLHKKWRGILERNVPAAVRQDTAIILRLKNHGKSDIVSWRIRCTIQVTPSAFLREKLNSGAEEMEWEVGGTDLIAPGECIEITLLRSGNFPQAKVNWTCAYTDIRDVNYVRFGGERSIDLSNLLANPVADVEQSTGESKLLADGTVHSKRVIDSGGPTQELRIGSRVNHPQFGDGVVVALGNTFGDDTAMILFDKAGKRNFNIRLAKLTVLK